jgi:hypothetical protein
MKKILVFILIASVFLVSCRKKNSNEFQNNQNGATNLFNGNTSDGSSFTPTIMTSVKGIVLDKNNNPISGVNVKLNDNSTSSSEKGLFHFNNIKASKRDIIHFSKSDYFKTSRAIQSKENIANYIKVILDAKTINSQFQVEWGGSGENVNLNNDISLDFSSTNIKDSYGYHHYGNVNVSVNKISPDDGIDFTTRIPGGDLLANDEDGNQTRLISFGMLDVVLTDDYGNELSTNGQTKITYPIPSNMISTAPNTIPLWHFDESDGIWKEEGIATKKGNNYEGYVSHFSNWNFDIPGLEAGLKGRIIDCKGKPLANVLVQAGQQSTSTSSNGEFEMFMIAGQSTDINLINNFGSKETHQIPAISVNQIHNAGDITLCSSSISGKVIDCNGNPAQNILVSSDYSPFSYAYTDKNGVFSFLFPENTSTSIIAEGFFGVSSSPVSIPAVSQSQTYNAGSIVVCNSETGITTVTEDKQSIQNTFSSMENCLSSLKNGYGAQAIKNFFNLDEGHVLSENWIEDMIEKLDDFIDLDAIDNNNKFNFNSNTGTYKWNQSNKSWTKSSSPGNKIIIEFPSTETTMNNDAKFTMDNYTDIALYYDGETIWAPSSLHADLFIGNTKVFEITGACNYDVGNPTPIPIDINSSLEFNPFKVTLKGQRVTSKKFEANVSIDDNSGCLTSLFINFEYKHDDYENIDIENGDLVSVKTIMTHGDMSIEGYLDGSLYQYNNVSTHQINAMTDVDVLHSGSKIGELILISQNEGEDEDEVHIIYSDGSSENTKVYYDPFSANVEQIFFSFFGEL